MDYNSRPWYYQVIANRKDGSQWRSAVTTDKGMIDIIYDESKLKEDEFYTSVVLTQERKGHSLGQNEV